MSLFQLFLHKKYSDHILLADSCTKKTFSKPSLFDGRYRATENTTVNSLKVEMDYLGRK